MDLRAYRPDDGPATFEVFHRALTVTAAQHYTAQQVSAWRARAGTAQDWQHRMDAARIALVMEDDAGLCAFATLANVDGETAEVHQLMCDPRCARQGAASALLERLVEEARAQGFSRLTAQASLMARGVFERHGFSITEPRTVLGMACFGMGKTL